MRYCYIYVAYFHVTDEQFVALLSIFNEQFQLYRSIFCKFLFGLLTITDMFMVDLE